MRKPERLLKLLTFLQSRRRATTAKTIAEYFQISERTVYRDIQALINTGVPVEGEAGIGYVLRKGELLAPLTFTEPELEALVLGVRMVQGWSDSELGGSASSALEKIRAILPDRLRYLKEAEEETLLVPDFVQAPGTEFSQPVREAIKNQQKLRLNYRDEKSDSTERTIWPLGLIYWGKVWTLVAWCELRTDYRTFRLDRIAELSSEEARFETTAEKNLRHFLKMISECDN